MDARVSRTLFRIERAAEILFQPGMVLLVLALVLGGSLDTDGWWHLANGRWMVQHGQILKADPFSYTHPGSAWAHPGYPYEIGQYLAYRWLGFRGVDLLAGLMISLVFLIEWNAFKTRALYRFLLVGASILLSVAAWSGRPNVFTMLGLVLFQLILEAWRQGNRRVIWLLPVVMLAWANLHSGFPVGFILVGASLLDVYRDPRQLKVLVGILLLMGLATLVTPYGINLYREILNTAGRAVEQSLIQEWRSPDFHTLYGQFFLLAITASLLMLGYARRPLRLSSLCLLVTFTALALVSQRNLALFAVVAPFAWLSFLAPNPGLLAPVASSRPNPLLTGLSLAFFIFSAAALAFQWSATITRPVNLASFPAGAVEYIQENHPPGRLFNGFNWGGYLIWALPEYPVFVDSRADIYGDALILQSLQVERAEPGWQEVVRQWDIHTALVQARAPLGEALSRAGWQLCYQDQQAEVYTDRQGCTLAP